MEKKLKCIDARKKKLHVQVYFLFLLRQQTYKQNKTIYENRWIAFRGRTINLNEDDSMRWCHPTVTWKRQKIKLEKKSNSKQTIKIESKFTEDRHQKNRNLLQISSV